MLTYGKNKYNKTTLLSKLIKESYCYSWGKNMKITALEIYRVEIPYKKSYKIAKHVVIKIITDFGIEGWGEAYTLSLRQPDIFFLIKHYLALSILGSNPLEISKIMLNLEKVLKENYHAKCAIDHALYDIAGKFYNVPVYLILGGAYRKHFNVSFTIDEKTPEQTVKTAQRLFDEGYQRLGLRFPIVEGQPKSELSVLELIRKKLGDNVALEVDFNGNYDKHTSLKLMQSMEAFNVESFEQPVAGEQLENMVELTEKINTPIVADESIRDFHSCLNIIQKKAADVLCIKPFKVGGIYYSKKIQLLAETFYYNISTGSMHPLGIGTAALQHFIASLPFFTTASYGSPMERLIDDITLTTSFTFKNGVVTLNEQPGLGVTIDNNKLKKYTTKFVRIEK